jgi:uncharacterized protein (DUF433 family)
MEVKSILTVDPEIQNGQPVFKGTRVPVESLFMHLEKGVSIDSFLEDFPSVSKEQVIAALGLAEKLFTSGNISKLYEIAA